MKKIVFMVMVWVGVLTVQANGYTYLTFETTDGAKASVPVSSLTVSISGTKLTNLSKMYFSNTDESSTTGIETVDRSQLDIDDNTEIYDLQGHKVSKEQMRRGVYIVKSKDRTYKMIVR